MVTTSAPVDWSELVQDVLSLVLKRLSFTDFARAKTVCSSWYAASRSTLPRENQTPWLIFNDHMNWQWQLFNPEEGKFYRMQNLSRFAECRCMATCGTWVLVLDKQAYFYIFNPFTLEIINLPPLESNCTTEFKRRGNYNFDINYGYGKGWSQPVESAVLWVDGRSKDYLVAWACLMGDYVCFSRKGDKAWTQIMYLRRYWFVDMAYKDKKLYILTCDGSIRILDFSGDYLPSDVPTNPYAGVPFRAVPWLNSRKKIRVTTSGDVLIILRLMGGGGQSTGFLLDGGQSTGFDVYKMNSTHVDWKRVDSLEEEVLVLDLSVTLPSKGVSGIKKDSIYFRHSPKQSIREVATYDIPTHKIEHFRQCSLVLDFDARWFVPCFGVGE